MPSFRMSVPHNLGRQEALKRLKDAASGAKAQYSDKVQILREEWRHDSGEFEVSSMGFKVSGVVQVEDKEILIDAKIPFAAVPFKGRVESMIRDRAKTLLS